MLHAQYSCKQTEQTEFSPNDQFSQCHNKRPRSGLHSRSRRVGNQPSHTHMRKDLANGLATNQA